jgi:hypothetical protein
MVQNLNSLLKTHLDDLLVLEKEYDETMTRGKMHLRDIAHANVHIKTIEIIELLKSNYNTLL